MKRILLLPLLLTTLVGLACSPSPDSNLAPLSSISNADSETFQLVSRSFLDGKVTLHVPSEFRLMSQETIRLKYPRNERPTLVLTNDNGGVNIAINHTSNLLPPDKVGELHKAMEALFRKTYPSATWYESTSYSIGDRECFIINIVTPALDTRIRNIMMGTSVEGRFLLVTFNTVVEFEDEWLEKGLNIISSIEIDST